MHSNFPAHTLYRTCTCNITWIHIPVGSLKWQKNHSIQVNKKHLKWKSSRIELEKSKKTRGYMQTGVIKNPTPLHEEYNPQSISCKYMIPAQTATA